MSSAGQTIESGHQDAVHDVQMDYYGKRLATCSSDRTIRIFAVTGDSHAHLSDLVGMSRAGLFTHPRTTTIDPATLSLLFL